MEKKGLSIISTNKKAYHDYHISDKIEAGIELTGSEVKSLRAGHGNLKDSYARIRRGEIFLIKAHIAPYKYSGDYDNHEAERDRRLLLHKKEINRLKRNIETKGITLIPLKLYFNEKGKVKVELGVAKGKRLYDKRAAIAEKDMKREMDRARKNRL
ncbi:MAG: SsrA-binding protein SmpB [Candidatus Marinimicrobia bacterium]|nr:SsrA-binding protein SmpB [Candidatus Neomarinimicrobiota bacterium]